MEVEKAPFSEFLGVSGQLQVENSLNHLKISRMTNGVVVYFMFLSAPIRALEHWEIK